MPRIHCFLFLLLGSVLAVGCTADTDPSLVEVQDSTMASDAAPANESTFGGALEGTDSDPLADVAQDGFQDTPGDQPSQTEDTEERPLETAEDFIAAINEQLQSSSQDVPGAIALAEQGYAALPDDENMLRGLAALLYQTLRAADDEAQANKQRMRLGELARILIERNQDSLDTLGNMPGVLMIEEAKALLSGNQSNEAWNSILEARNYGFDQTELLFYDPAFAEITENDQAMVEIKKWLADEVTTKLDETESFPFDFTLPGFSGEEVSLSDFEGKLLIVDFWGTWCPPCRAVIPHIVELLEKQRDHIAVVGINIENPQGETSFEDAKASFDDFVASQPINYPCVAGTQETVEQVPGFEGYPTMLFVDGEGNVRLKLTGYHPLPLLEAAVEALLSEQSGQSKT